MMKALKLDPMTFLIGAVALGVVLTMSTQASGGADAAASQIQTSQVQVSKAQASEMRMQTASTSFRK